MTAGPDGRPLISAAFADHDHVRDLARGRVEVEGVRMLCEQLDRPETIFERFLSSRQWDVCELSLAAYVALRSGGDRSLTAIPAFPARAFRHSAIYVREGLSDPRTLAGRRVGIPVWAQTAGVWARGMLADEHGIALDDVEWHQAGLDAPGRREPAPLSLPAGVTVRRWRDRTLDGMLRCGDLDAVISARPPRCYLERSCGVTRLWPDSETVERDYLARTGLFPIMHVTVIRSELHARHPWIAPRLLEALQRAKAAALARLLEAPVPPIPLPWAQQAAESARSLMGEDPWPYGVGPNRGELETFLRYAREQGLCPGPLTVDELFCVHEPLRPETPPARARARAGAQGARAGAEVVR